MSSDQGQVILVAKQPNGGIIAFDDAIIIE